MKAASVLAAAVALLLLPGVVLAQVPGVMSFQGRVLKSDGTPETGSPDLTFSIYAAAEGGDSLWHESQTVALTNGFYSVKLGAVTSFGPTLFDGKALWLGVTVGLDVSKELKPRQYIATVPYAFKAAKAASLSAGGSGIQASGERIQNVGAPSAATDAATKAYVDATTKSSGDASKSYVDAAIKSSSDATKSYVDAVRPRILGGVLMFCNQTSTTTRDCQRWGAGVCNGGTDCNAATCSAGTLVSTSQGWCYAVDGDGYCYSHLCVIQ